MKAGLIRRTALTLGAAALIVAAAFAVLVLAIGDLRDNASRATHSEEVLAAANRLEKTVLDLETGARGYTLTGQERFLEPWRAGLVAFPREATQLERLVADNPEQEARARAIAAAGGSYIADFSRPLVARTRARLSRGAEIVAAGEGKRRVDALRAQLAAFRDVENGLASLRGRHADDAAIRAIALAVGGIVASLLVLGAFAFFLGRTVVLPVRRLAGVAGRLASGDLSARLSETGRAEVRQLERAFNEMAETLERGRDELESQNAELELQTAELEEQQVRLGEANAELQAQSEELERTVAQVADEKERVEAFYGYGELLVSQLELEPRAQDALTGLAELSGCEVGALYSAVEEGEPLALRAVRALDRADLPPVVEPGVGLAGRAAAERRPVTASRGSAGLRLRMLGEDVAVAHELHLPLTQAGRVVGIVTLGRVGERPFADEEVELLEHLARQAAMALGNAGALLATRRLVEINRAVLDAAVDGIRLVDLDGSTLLANAAIERLTTEVFGFPGDSTLYERAALAERVADPESYRAALARVADDPDAETVDEFELLDSGRVFRRYMAPVRMPDGDRIGRIVVVSEVTAERQASRLATINTAVLDATTDAIVMLDRKGRIVLANAATGRLAALLGVEAEGDLLELADRMRARTADPEAFAAHYERFSEPEYEHTHEYEIVDLGRVFQSYTAPVRDAAGEVLGRLISVREVTSERESERLKTELVATVSHELRTPLASILGFSELLATRDVDAETGKSYAETINREAARLTDLINDFLDLQRIEQGQMTLELETFELGSLLREEVALFDGQSAAHSVSFAAPEEPVEVVGERARIAQVVGNLLSNAIKYSPEGGTVELRVERRDSVVRVAVADRGLGIPAGQQQHVFKKFFRADSSDTREIGGTGLGLALCRELVEAHGGRIGFESVEGQGSVFWFELPAGTANGDRARVLVVEDDAAAADLLRLWLADRYAVDVVPSGELALGFVASRPPDVVCLDIGLAGVLDGWQVLEQLKRDPATAAVPVVVCSGGDGHEQAAALGAADFLAKPFAADELRTAIERLLPDGSGSVLVADDDPAIRRLVAESLRGGGIALREAADGEEAMAAIAAEPPDALVLDLAMPRLDGFGVLERLQASPKLRAIPVIVLTARRLSAEERATLRSRTVALLAKSAYSAEELRRLVRVALGQAA